MKTIINNLIRWFTVIRLCSLAQLIDFLKKEPVPKITITPALHMGSGVGFSLTGVTNVAYVLEVKIYLSTGKSFTYTDKLTSGFTDLFTGSETNEKCLLMYAQEYVNEIYNVSPETTVLILDEEGKQIPSTQLLSV